MDDKKVSCLARAFQSPSAKIIKDCLIKQKFFDEAFFEYESTAIEVFKTYLQDFRDFEIENNIPYRLTEDYKLYAVDAIIIARSVGCTAQQAEAIARIFNAFYIAVHYYDDHVEHQDKFFSKFEFSKDSDAQTQKGASPFSFLLTSMLVIDKYLKDPDLHYSNAVRIELLSTITQRLLRYTPYLTSERKQHLTTNEVLVMKQRNISGSATMIIAELIKPLLKYNDSDYENLSKGLFLLGSLTQITDDIRDANIDYILHNANLLNSVIEMIGENDAFEEVANIYLKEEGEARANLVKVMPVADANLILSIPFYPFFIDKSKLVRS